MISEPELVKLIIELISEENKIPIEEIRPAHSFFETGLDSISAIFIMEKLEQHLKIELSPLYFWDYPTIEQYASNIIKEVLKNESS